MLIRLWLLLSALWAVFLVGVNVNNEYAQWPLVLSLAAAPFIGGFLLMRALRFVVFGLNRQPLRPQPIYRPKP